MASRFNLDAAGKMTCYHHPSREAAASCKWCGKGICKDCYDSYGAGMGAGKALCFDCAEEMVKKNTSEIMWLREQVEIERKWMKIGAIVGAIVLGIGMAVDGGFLGFLLGVFLGASLGASLGTIINFGMENGAVSAVFAIFVSPIISIYRFVKRVNQIKQCEEIIASDARILQEMRDYFAYTQTMEKNAGMNLSQLADQGGTLFGNTYAQAVLSKGVQAAQADLRQGTVQIAANGEIIRSFDRRIAQRAA